MPQTNTKQNMLALTTSCWEMKQVYFMAPSAHKGIQLAAHDLDLLLISSELTREVSESVLTA